MALQDALVVHGDIKPDNVILTPDGRLVVIDLGVGEQLASVDEQVSYFCGLERYGAPEAVAFNDCDSSPPYNGIAADWYSVGVVLRELKACISDAADSPSSETTLGLVDDVLAGLTAADPVARVGPKDLLSRLDRLKAEAKPAAPNQPTKQPVTEKSGVKPRDAVIRQLFAAGAMSAKET